MTTTELYDYLLANPGTTYASLSTDARTLLREQLRPSGGFTEQQRTWLYGDGGFWLVVSPAMLATMRAALPSGLGLHGRRLVQGNLALPASLLTDCLEPADTWHSIAAHLAALPIVHSPEFAPIPEN